MDEYFLQFLWNFQKFTNKNVKLTTGEPLTVFEPGYQNGDAGPDFSEAKLKIGEMIWSGSVEIHYRSSAWYQHNHHKDPKYKNVILHVVWSHDREILNDDGLPIPTLQLSQYAPENLEKEYRKYINQPQTIRCTYKLHEIPSIHINTMLDKAFAGRLQEKSDAVLDVLEKVKNDWEETAYRILAKNFGFKTNAESFERLASTLPYKCLKKHQDHPRQVEAMLFGQAGFLEEGTDPYSKQLSDEYHFLQKKYGLTQKLSRHHWKFSKLRPANFPTIRIAQFSAMVSATKNLFSSLTSISDRKGATEIIRNPLSPFWQDHYDFGKESKRDQGMGESSVENIIINSVVPLLAAYSKHTADPDFIEKAERLLDTQKSEKNRFIKKWEEAGLIPKSAKDTQALLYQYRQFCQKKKCLQCNIGLQILKP